MSASWGSLHFQCVEACSSPGLCDDPLGLKRRNFVRLLHAVQRTKLEFGCLMGSVGMIACVPVLIQEVGELVEVREVLVCR
jgi:hypothetical protein